MIKLIIIPFSLISWLVLSCRCKASMSFCSVLALFLLLKDLYLAEEKNGFWIGMMRHLLLDYCQEWVKNMLYNFVCINCSSVFNCANGVLVMLDNIHVWTTYMYAPPKNRNVLYNGIKKNNCCLHALWRGYMGFGDPLGHHLPLHLSCTPSQRATIVSLDKTLLFHMDTPDALGAYDGTRRVQSSLWSDGKLQWSILGCMDRP